MEKLLNFKEYTDNDLISIFKDIVLDWCNSNGEDYDDNITNCHEAISDDFEWRIFTDFDPDYNWEKYSKSERNRIEYFVDNCWKRISKIMKFRIYGGDKDGYDTKMSYDEKLAKSIFK